MIASLLCALACWPDAALAQNLAFSNVLLLDPHFKLMLFVQVPLVAILLTIAAEYGLFKATLYHQIEPKRLFRWVFLSNVGSGFMVVLLFAALTVLFNVMLKDAPIWLFMAGWVYFGLSFIAYGYLGKRERFRRMFGDKPDKNQRFLLFFTNATAYLLVYSYVYFVVFGGVF